MADAAAEAEQQVWFSLVGGGDCHVWRIYRVDMELIPPPLKKS